MYFGTLTNDSTHYLMFTTRDTDGEPATLDPDLQSAPEVVIYYNNNVAQITAGITLTTDFDGVTGLNNLALDLSADGNYTTGRDYHIVIEDGSVDGTSVSGEVVGWFNIENRFDEVDVVELGGSAASATDLKDFADSGYDPATNKVQGVVLVDTTTTNTDMRGTDGANTTVPDAAGTAAALHAATDALIAALNDFDPAVDVVARVTLCDTTTTNTDMRGTDGANTTVPDAAGTAAGLHAATDALIAALNDFDPAADTVAHVTLVDTTTTNTDMRGTDGANTTVPDAAGTAAALHAVTDAAIAVVNAAVAAVAATGGPGPWTTGGGAATDTETIVQSKENT